jgi:transposase
MEILTMNREKQRQARVLTQLLAGRLTAAEAAEALRRSKRWVEAMRPRFREHGLPVLVHGNTGRQPHNALAQKQRERVLAFAQGKYKNFNLTQLWEMLTEVEGMSISKRSVHRICTTGGVPSPKARKRRVLHRKRRERCAREGDMIQMDGSPHDWLEGRGPRLTLIAGVDDATGFKWAEFRYGEDLEGYMTLFRRIVETRGIPGSVYTDRSVIVAGVSFKYRPWHDEPSGPSQFGRALEELGVSVILANSPQAKGRVERSHGVDQDRLCSWLRLAGARTLEEANAVLKRYLRDANRRFAIAPRDAEPAWRQRPSGNLGDIFCIKEKRTVANDNTVRIYGHIYDIPPGSQKASYAGREVIVHRRYDGTTGLYLDGTRIAGDPPLPLKPRRKPDKPRPQESLAS